jgi:hypothetical protein
MNFLFAFVHFIAFGQLLRRPGLTTARFSSTDQFSDLYPFQKSCPGVSITPTLYSIISTPSIRGHKQIYTWLVLDLAAAVPLSIPSGSRIPATWPSWTRLRVRAAMRAAPTPEPSSAGRISIGSWPLPRALPSRPPSQSRISLSA